MASIIIGKWIEKEPREIIQHTSYAADYITHKTIPGEYPVHLIIDGGYNVPMPHWCIVTIKTNITGGKLYSGFGGVNFASTDVEKEPSEYTAQMYDYYLPEQVAQGLIVLDTEWQFLLEEKYCFQSMQKHGMTWEKIASVEKAQKVTK